ncbi:MAG: serine hydrolase domain-containing protein [Gammaproteobacteria bacterium]
MPLPGRIMLLVLAITITPPVVASPAEPRWMRSLLYSFRQQYDMPALAAVVVVGGEVVAASAVGVRRAGRSERIRRGDRFHIGSIAKPFTATLTGILAQRGKLHWDDRLERMFPGVPMHPDYRDVTITQLLTHRSGMPYQPTTPESETDKAGRSLYEKRQAYVRAALKDSPEARPGTRQIYGGGHILVANYMERLTRTPFESLIERELFAPLALRSARFGDPSLNRKEPGPWSHVRENGRNTPLPPDPAQRNQARSPVGRNLSMSITDLGRFVAEHLRGGRGESDFLLPPVWAWLQEPAVPGAMAPAWGVDQVPWAKGPVLAHGGSNLRNFALCKIVRDEDFAICTASNIGYDGIGDHHETIIQRLAREIRAGRFAE